MLLHEPVLYKKLDDQFHNVLHEKFGVGADAEHLVSCRANKRSCYLSQYNVPQKRQFLQLPHRVPFARKGGLWQSCVLYFLSKYSLRVTTEIQHYRFKCMPRASPAIRCCSTRNCQTEFSGARFYGSSGNKHSNYC